MRLPRIFIEQPLAVGVKIQLDPAASHYVRNVLRLKPDMSIALFNGQACCDYHSTLSFDGKKTLASIVSQSTNSITESQLDSEIIQGLSRSDHLDWMIQKTTELGVRRISIFNANHSQIPVKSNQLEKKHLHWLAVARKACEQSGRQIPPQVNFFDNIQQALDGALGPNQFLLDFNGPRLGALLQSAARATRISILLGPEGGLSITEINHAHTAGFVSSQIGPRVLRTETAAITALAIAQSCWGDI